MRISHLQITLNFILMLMLPGTLAADVPASSPPTTTRDWPMWRCNVGRTASTDMPLAEKLHLQWKRQLGPRTPAWPEDPRLQFDSVYHPVVHRDRLVVASNRDDSVSAFDVTSGKPIWRFFADGPVRFAPICWQGSVMFGADDGQVYCVGIEDGELLWRFDAAINRRLTIGNGRMISVWPIRSGPVVHNEKLYFTAGVWPFEGVFLYALDASTGELASVADDQQAAVVSNNCPVRLLDCAPNGYLAISNNRLFIPNGRARATMVDLKTGKVSQPHYGATAVDFSSTRGLSDWWLCAHDGLLFHGSRVHRFYGQPSLSNWVPRPVVCGGTAIFGDNGLLALRLAGVRTVETLTRWGEPMQVYDFPDLKRFDAESFGQVHLAAANRVYAGHTTRTEFLFAIDISDAGEPERVSWRSEISNMAISSMLAASDRLLVVASDGEIYCYGAEEIEPTSFPLIPSMETNKHDDWTGRVANIKTALGENLIATDGVQNQPLALILGIHSGELIAELLRQTNLRLIVVEDDNRKVAALRTRYANGGIYGQRLAVIGRPLQDCTWPPYWASLVTSEDGSMLRNTAGVATQTLTTVLRPFGGILYLHDEDGFGAVPRSGPVEGTANWSHQYGDAGNRLSSPDTRVKAPLGVSWFGGPAANFERFYDRHEWGPSPLVVDGRMFLQGPERLTAVDIYTGRLLWQRAFLPGESPGRRGSFFEGTSPGYHFCACSDGLYVAMNDHCTWIDPASGQVRKEFRLPDQDRSWGRIRIQGPLLIASVFGSPSSEVKAPQEIYAVDRRSGEIRWQQTAQQSFPLVAAGPERVYCFDGHLEDFYNAVRRRGLVPESSQQRRLKAFDLESGDLLWEVADVRIATWLSYLADQDVLVASNKDGIDAIDGATGTLKWTKQEEGLGFAGHPENSWDRVVLLSDKILDQRGPGSMYDLTTGQQILRTHPTTKEQTKWTFTKDGHNCDYAVACPSLATFRASEAGILIMDTGETCRLGGFRSGCRNSLIPAGGLLNAPNMARGCSCAYSVFTSLAMHHRPDCETWSYGSVDGTEEPISQIGVNLGGLGDRHATSGILWLEAPQIDGPPATGAKVAGDRLQYFRLHQNLIEGDDLRWVAAFGCEGITSIRIPVGSPAGREYRVRLVFCEPAPIEPGQRIFHVDVNGQRVFSNLDVAGQAGRERRVLIKEISPVSPGSSLDVEFTAVAGRPLLSGVEIATISAPSK